MTPYLGSLQQPQPEMEKKPGKEPALTTTLNVLGWLLIAMSVLGGVEGVVSYLIPQSKFEVYWGPVLNGAFVGLGLRVSAAILRSLARIEQAIRETKPN